VKRARTLSDLEADELRDRVVLVRVDLNVPLDEDRRVTDDMRVRAVLPTLRHLQRSGAKSVLVSHLGRPDGAPDPAFSLRPVAELLSGLLGRPVTLLSEAPGSPALSAEVKALPTGAVALLENIRFLPGETAVLIPR
jgi:phosphoglycerate kinase